jgi:hypothetical protein
MCPDSRLNVTFACILFMRHEYILIIFSLQFEEMVDLQNCVDLQNHDPDLHSETCDTSSGDCNQVTGIKVEIISIKEEEGPEPIVFSEIKTEHEVSCMSVCSLFCTSYRY